jgi:hydroxymethylglutaryl-CoA lyase
MLERAGVSTGMNLDSLIGASQWLSDIMGRKLPGMVAQAPPFPKIG